MSVKLHNTLSRQVEEFTPGNGSEVKLYTCGPTVYSYYHIGNLRNAVFNDTLRRALEAAGYKVKHVMNITDVGHLTSDADEGEDKLEKGASAEGKSVREVADFYTEAFKKDVTALNILPPNGYEGKLDNYARATDFIDDQIDIVTKLLEKGFAYQTAQAIYFDVTKLPDYGKLTGQKLSDKEVGARDEVVTDKDKHHPQDFALWFFTVGHFAGHSMHWPSPWGEGFPGWHLECSAIIHATLGEPIDIHTGAVDLIGTHHTNEIAQTEAATGKTLSNYWVHNEYVLIDGRKMSKSLNNIYRLEDVTAKGYDPLALRLLFLQSHYRSQSNFTWEALDDAAAFLRRLSAWADLKFQAPADTSGNVGDTYSEALTKIKNSLFDDLNTADALGRLSGLASQSEAQGVDADRIQVLLEEVDTLLGLSLSNREDIGSELKDLIDKRETARRAKDWPLSDKLRDRLLEHKLELNDTPDGAIWRRI